MPHIKPGRKISLAHEFIRECVGVGSLECQIFPFDQKRISFDGRSRSPQWISCFHTYGPPPAGAVPVKTCGVHGCINGLHFKWGTLDEAQDGRVFKTRVGSKNPNAKLDEQKVQDIKSRVYKTGRDRMLTAKEFGISTKTLGNIIKGRSWDWVKGDEF